MRKLLKRKAFTLIELVLSIFLLGIIVYFLYGAVASLQKSNTIFSKESQRAFYNQKVLSMLQKDLFFATKMELEGYDNTLANLQTNNSLFDIDAPYVSWMLKPDLKKLVRFESTLPFSQMKAKNSAYYHMSIIPKKCEKFRIYQSKKRENILIYIKFEGEEPLMYEFYKPMQKISDQNKTKNPDQNRTDIKR
jgi:prepilin-type N-terminal cleavage/methylation domain-containing protein